MIVELRKEIDSLKATLDDSTKTLKYLKAENKALMDKVPSVKLIVHWQIDMKSLLFLSFSLDRDPFPRGTS